MSIDISVSIEIGFRISHKELMKPFLCTREEKSHTEPRFHEKTGKRLKDAVVIDREEEEYVFFGGEEVDNFILGDLIAKKVGCEVHMGGIPSTGDPEWILFVSVKKMGRMIQDGTLDLGDKRGLDIPLDSLSGLKPKMGALKKKLEDLGIKAGKPAICLDWCIS